MSMRRTFAVAASAAVGASLLLSAQVSTAPAASAYVKHGCKYSGTNPTLYYQIGSTVGSARRTATNSGAGRWNAVAVPGTFTAWSSGKPVNVAITEWSAADTYEAVTSFSCSSGLYTSNKTTITWNSPSPGGIGSDTTALRMVATHEFGHAYGLNHMSTTCNGTKTVMVQGKTKWSCSWGTEPWQDDINGVDAIY